MKRFIQQGLSRRFYYDGWALRIKGGRRPLEWTVSTTREEVREIKRRDIMQGMRRNMEIIKVKIRVEALED